MRPCQPTLSKPGDGEVLLLYLKEQKHTGSAVLVQRANILFHTPEVQRSLARQTEKLTSIREPLCLRRFYPKTFGFQEDKFQNHRASGRYFRPRVPPKFYYHEVVLYLEGTLNSSTEGNRCYLDNSPRLIDIESGPSPEDRVRCCIKSIKTLGSRQQNIYSPPGEISTGPTRSEHEALKSLRFQRRIIRDYEFLHDVRRYLRVVQRRIGLHTSTKGLVPPEEGMRKIAIFTRLLPSTELLHPRVRAYVL
ncbi:hypothetical protein F2Q69_00023035 [Brassica cretica]|uniref:Uncharacterized protein n=1 Tax=Brassica cretica TaxID=69181 RepID=A0A8S9Q3B6_BRACR|nr:hypothetical protein F2Q69_00023035 [Brassica cretica]